jgi:glyoxylase-like metal-dependent hydrolase (beta-lactamase superfamily II)
MVRLIGQFYVISNSKFTHPWDANAYLVTGDKPTLIDCGSSLGFAALKAALDQLDLAPSDIQRVIATHGHWDHVSGMAQLREESDAQLWMHADDRAAVEAGDEERTSAFLYGQSFPAVKVDRLLQDGEEIAVGPYRLHVLHTPGHSPGSVVFLTEINGIKVLIAGDTLWGGFHPKLGSDLDVWAHSLDRLLNLDFDVVTIGHCPPTLIFDAKTKVCEARQQFGVFFDPWFKPFHLKFVY